MKTTNVILLGVVGVGAVGAYMYMKNKKAENALLSDSLPAPATSQGGATPPLATTPLIPTPNLTEPVKISSDTNLDAYNLQKVLEELKEFDNMVKTKTVKDSWTGQIKLRYTNITEINKLRQPIINKLAKLGYKFDNGLLIKI